MRHGSLVGAVGGAGCQPALADGFFARRQTAEGFVVGLGNAQLGQRRKIQLRHRAGHTLGPCQRILDGDAHIRHAQLRQNGMVAELHRRVDDAFALDDNLNFILRQTEQPRCLDQFKTLVHQGRRVDGDLCPHIPVGMLERIRLGLGAQLLGRHTKEGTAGGSQQDLFQRFGAVGILQTLEDGAVFAVHGQQMHAVLCHRIGD